MFSSMPDRSQLSKMTSEQSPESSQDLAVIMPAFPDEHMADTAMVGP